MNEGRRVRGPSNSPSPQVEVTTPRLSGLILAMLVAVLLAGRTLWLMQHREDQDTSPFLVLLLLGESPLLIAGVLILTRKVESVARGAGLASAAAFAYILLAIPLFLDTVISSGWDRAYHNVDALKKFIPVSVAGAIWVLVAAFPERSRSRAGFWRYFAIGLAYVIPALFVLFSTAARGSRYSNERASLVSPFQGALPPVRQLTACLIRHHFLHPQDRYPQSLEGIGPDWNCDEALKDRRSSLPYWIFYSTEEPSGGTTDFRIVAIPGERNHLGSDPFVSDARGEVIRFTGLAMDTVQRRKTYGPLFAVRTDDASYEIAGLAMYRMRDRIHEYMRNHNSMPPTSLQEILDEKDNARFNCTGAPDPAQFRIGITLEQPCYRTSYLLASDERAPAFAISVQCMNYGNGCIRSFFLDYNGTVHATSEPRPAVPTDDGLLPCETTTPCTDLIWTTSRPPAEWMFLVAHTHYFVHTTRWR